MRKTVITLLVFYYLFRLNAAAQNIELVGRIIDKVNKPLSFVTIELRALKIGTYTDTSGFFTINIPEKNQKGTISFYALGYEKKELLISKLLNSENKTIELEQKIFRIREVKIKPKKTKLIKLGVKQKKPWRYQITNVFGAQNGHYIRNENNLSGFVKIR